MNTGTHRSIQDFSGVHNALFFPKEVDDLFVVTLKTQAKTA